MATNPEQDRLAEHNAGQADWKRWGPYLSDRAWGTVREDYSADGDSWNYFPHDHARSRAYRWNEDGIGGFCDEKQHLCLAVALWNEKDPILKERMFGLEQSAGQPRRGRQGVLLLPRRHADPLLHEDALQVSASGVSRTTTWWRVNGKRNQSQPEYELFDALADTFPANRYFDVFIEYAKAGPEDILCRITAINRGPDAGADSHLCRIVWYRNSWSWEPTASRAP